MLYCSEAGLNSVFVGRRMNSDGCTQSFKIVYGKLRLPFERFRFNHGTLNRLLTLTPPPHKLVLLFPF